MLDPIPRQRLRRGGVAWLLGLNGIGMAFAGSPTGAEITAFVETQWTERVERLRHERQTEMDQGVVHAAGQTMRFVFQTYGTKPSEGWPLFISLHGGGNTPTRVNDSQWKNQIRLGDRYRPTNALYLAPRAPTDTWNLWHQAHMDPLLDRLIENFVHLKNVDPNRVYIMGYSAGGDGVYQLAPRMADRFAAAAMMAGHPNETSPVGLRNLPFALHVGALDAGYKRNRIAMEWNDQLAALQAKDPGGYRHQVRVHPGKGHWMDLQDQVAVPWMQQFVREPLPDRIVWRQDDVTHDTFYWLAVPEGSATKGQQVTVVRAGQTIRVVEHQGLDRLILRLNDAMMDLDQPITVIGPDDTIWFEGQVERSKELVQRTLTARGDRQLVFSAEIVVELPAAPEADRPETSASPG